MATTLQQSDTSMRRTLADSAQLHREAERLAARAARLYRWRAYLWCLSVVLLSALALIALDHLLHVEELGLRWLLSGVWLAIAIASAIWWLKPALSFSLRPVSVASWIERRRPDLNGRLSNAVAIAELPASDLRYGSHGFRLAALEGFTSDSHGIEWRSYLDFKPTLRAGLALGAVVLACAVLAIAYPATTARGLQRLVNPWLAAPWPRADQLRFVNLPTMIASGSELQLEVIDDRPPLPASLELQIKHIGQASHDSDLKLKRMPLRVLNDVALATFSDTRSPFSIRVVGGDDTQTAWHDIQVVELPELLEHRFHVEPPSYSRQEPNELVGERIEVLASSRITFHGRFSGRLREVTAVAINDSRPGAENNEPHTVANSAAATQPQQPVEWPAVVSSDRQSFALFEQEGGLPIDTDQRWRLRFKTQEGLEVVDSKTWSVHAVSDRPPMITLAPLEPPIVTRESTVNIFGDASDDLELMEVKLVWQSDDDQRVHERVLWPDSLLGDEASSSQPTNSAAQNTDSQPEDSPSRPQRRAASVRYYWRPAEDRLPIAQAVTLHLEARDSAGQITRSAAQSLQIQDAQAVLAQIQAEEAKTFEPLRQLMEAQRRNQQAVERTRDILQEIKTVDAAQLEALSAARQTQQSISQQLAHSPESVLRKLQSLSEQLDRNGLSDSDGARHIAELARRIERLSDNVVTPAIKDLDDAHRNVRAKLEAMKTGDEDASLISQQIERAAQRQQQAARGFGQLVDSVAAAETTADLRREFVELLARQNEVRTQTERFQMERLAQPDSRAHEAQQVGLRSDQQSLARAVDDLAATINKQLRSTTNVDQEALAPLEHARQALIEHRASQHMRDAAALVDSSRLSAAIDAQRAAVEALVQAAEAFDGGEGVGLESTAAGLQETANRLDQLAQQELHVAEQLQKASDKSATDRATEQQTELAKRTAELSGELLRRADKKLSDTVAEAQQHAEAAAEQAREQAFDQAATSAQQAAEKLQQAQQSAEHRAAEIDQQIAAQKLLDLGNVIKDLIRLQEPIVETLIRLGDARPKSSVNADAWNAEVREAAASQESVRLQLIDVAQRTKAADPFGWLLAQCDIDMTRTVAALERHRLAPDAVDSAEHALRKLLAAQQALADPPDADSKEREQTASSNTDADTAEEKNDRRPTMASLKLLRALQADINRRTNELQSSGAHDSAPEMLRLAEEQQALAEQTQKIIQQVVQ